MNALHHWLCRSARWRKALERDILPWALQGVPLGDDLLELGPGPGLTTDLLQHRVARLTAIELDSGLAATLGDRFSRGNVRVLRGDATSMPFAESSFSSAIALTMLHHLPDSEAQDRLFRETHRVLRPGGAFLGTDSLDSFRMRLFHIFDTLVPLDPGTIESRLARSGFEKIRVEVRPGRLRFEAYRS